MSMRILLLAGLLGASGIAVAQPRLVSATPAEKSAVAPEVKVELQFDRKLLAASSDATLFMTSMPGMSGHQPMGMAVTVTPGADGRSLAMVPEQPLPRGEYRVDWKAVDATKQTGRGQLNFSVK